MIFVFYSQISGAAPGPRRVVYGPACSSLSLNSTATLRGITWTSIEEASREARTSRGPQPEQGPGLGFDGSPARNPGEKREHRFFVLTGKWVTASINASCFDSTGWGDWRGGRAAVEN